MLGERQLQPVADQRAADGCSDNENREVHFRRSLPSAETNPLTHSFPEPWTPPEIQWLSLVSENRGILSFATSRRIEMVRSGYRYYSKPCSPELLRYYDYQNDE